MNLCAVSFPKTNGLVSLRFYIRVVCHSFGILTSLETKEKKAQTSVLSVQRNAKSSGWTLLGKKKTASKGVRGKTSGKRKTSSLPPNIDATVTVHHVFRFSANAGVTAKAVSATTIAGACGGMCPVVNNNITAWASSFKIHRVTVWPAPSTTSAVTPMIDWLSPVSANTKDSTKLVSVPEGVTVERPLVSRPPRGTLCSQWIDTSAVTTTVLFYIGVSAGSIIDLDITFTMVNNLAGISVVIASGVLGTIYYLALDGPASNVLRPLGLPSTA